MAIQQSKSYTTVHSRKINRKPNNIVKWIIEQIQVSSKNNFKENPVKQHETNIDLDAIIDEICDLLLQDLILPWYKDVSYEKISFTQTIKYEILIRILK